MHALRSKMTAAKVAGILAGAAAAVSAFAMRADAASVRLSLSQTLALYGTEIPAVYYNSDNGTYENITFRFAGDTLSWLSELDVDAGHKVGFEALYNGTSGVNTLDSWRDTSPCLIYECNFHPVVSDSSSYAEVELTPAFVVQSVNMYRQYIFYSGDVDPESTNVGSSGGWYQNSWCESICSTPIGRVYNYLLNNGAWQTWNRFNTYGVWRAWDASSVGSTINGTDAPLYGIYVDPTNSQTGSTFDYSGQTLHLNSVRAVQHGPFQEWTVYLLLGCPEIYGEYAGPTIPATVTTPTTTRPVWTAETVTSPVTGVTIDNFQDDIQEIIRNQRWQLYNQEIMIRNQMVQNENLRQILNRLDDIYNKMSIDTQNPLNTQGSMWQEFAGALTGMTTHTMPNYVLQGLTFWADCSQEILMRYDFLVPLGAFALTLLVIYYVLFKGRTS